MVITTLWKLCRVFVGVCRWEENDRCDKVPRSDPCEQPRSPAEHLLRTHDNPCDLFNILTILLVLLVLDLCPNAILHTTRERFCRGHYYRDPSADRIVLLTRLRTGLDCNLLSRSSRLTLMTRDAS